MLKSGKTKTMIAFLVTAVSFSSARAVPAAASRGQQTSETEITEAQEILQQFTVRFIESKDLGTIVKALYVSDFMERYRTRSEDLRGARHVSFVPGLDYDSRVLAEANTEEWQRFYVAANNLFFFGVISVLRKSPGNIENLKAGDMYPASVQKLLKSNPNLANMIVKDGPANSITSAEEMRKASDILEQANTVMRQALRGKPAAKIDMKELAAQMKGDDFFKPHVDILDDEFFGFPKGTRILRVTTPLLFQLVLVRVDGGLKILWAEPYLGD